jgi:hypothetical protein
MNASFTSEAPALLFFRTAFIHIMACFLGVAAADEKDYGNDEQ